LPPPPPPPPDEEETTTAGDAIAIQNVPEWRAREYRPEDEDDKTYEVTEEEEARQEHLFAARARASSQHSSQSKEKDVATLLVGSSLPVEDELPPDAAAADQKESPAEQLSSPSLEVDTTGINFAEATASPATPPFTTDSSSSLPSTSAFSSSQEVASSSSVRSPRQAAGPVARGPLPRGVVVMVKGQEEPLGVIDIEGAETTTFATLRSRIVDELDNVPREFAFVTQNIPIGRRQEEKKFLSILPADAPVYIKPKDQSMDATSLVAASAPVIPEAPPVPDAFPFHVYRGQAAISKKRSMIGGGASPVMSTVPEEPNSESTPQAPRIGQEIAAKLSSLRNIKTTPIPVQQLPRKISVLPGMLASLSAALQRRRDIVSVDENETDFSPRRTADARPSVSAWEEDLSSSEED